QVELAELLFESHAGEERVDPPFQSGTLGGGRAYADSDRDDQQRSEHTVLRAHCDHVPSCGFGMAAGNAAPIYGIHGGLDKPRGAGDKRCERTHRRRFMHRSPSFEQFGRRLLLGLALAAFTASTAASQTSTGSIRGYVTDSSGASIEGAHVVAVSVLNGAQRDVATQARGFYAILGLTPGEYDVTARQIGMVPQKIHVRVLIGEVYPLDFKLAASAIQVEAVTVVAAAGVETRTSEVATNVTRQQMENLPSSSRNFLDLAALAPGTQVSLDRLDGTSKTFSSGAQGAEGINVFIDGASFKNDVLPGGVAGQQESRGN